HALPVCGSLSSPQQTTGRIRPAPARLPRIIAGRGLARKSGPILRLPGLLLFQSAEVVEDLGAFLLAPQRVLMVGVGATQHSVYATDFLGKAPRFTGWLSDAVR
ncbi:MAG: hypothetical protein M3328_12175, partial [Chloroflexota bacterium]|nr:hypothetical protein [Chloroflexota bacterium]